MKNDDRKKSDAYWAMHYDATIAGVGGGIAFLIAGVAAGVLVAMGGTAKSVFGTFIFVFASCLVWMHDRAKKNKAERESQQKLQVQKQQNELRLARKMSYKLSDAPTTLIANTILHNKEVHSMAVKAKGYDDLLAKLKQKNIGTMVWKDENVSISFYDERLNRIELDAIVKQTK